MQARFRRIVTTPRCNCFRMQRLPRFINEPSHLPRAAQLPPVPGLPPVDGHGAVPTYISIDQYKRTPPPTLPRGRTLLGGTRFLIAAAIASVGTGYFLAAISEMDFGAPKSRLSETQLVTPSPLPQAVPPPTQLRGRTAEGEYSEQQPSLTESSEDRPTKSETEGRSPEAPSKGDAASVTGSNPAHPASPKSSADAAVEARNSALSIEGERGLAASRYISTCFPSASAVRQDNPTAWPSWTLRAPGHESTKCWYAATRATAHHH
jgi:hypothetical protein